MNKSDLELYTPEKWYVNIYNKNGHLLLSWGFTSKKIAEHTQACIIEKIESMLQSGAKKDPNVEVPTVEEPIGWKVGEETFSNYHDALWYSWNNHNAKIKGMFRNESKE